MKTDASLPELPDRVTTADGYQILRELEHELEKVIARHNMEKTKPKSGRKSKSAAKSRSKRA